ncbi:mucin-5AC-like [Saccostrea cucullata]|uniref:mucin-5AC-like n=1 Tax=Saccostrea cuccullata TaxID=36930 RepID=UPI002ED560A2
MRAMARNGLVLCLVGFLPLIQGWYQNQNQNVNINTNSVEPFVFVSHSNAASYPNTNVVTHTQGTHDTHVRLNFHAPISNTFTPTLNIGGGGWGPAKAPSAPPKTAKAPKKSPTPKKSPKKMKLPKKKAPAPPKAKNPVPPTTLPPIPTTPPQKAPKKAPKKKSGGSPKKKASYPPPKGGSPYPPQRPQSHFVNIKSIRYPSNQVTVIGHQNEVHTVAGLRNNIQYQKKVMPRPSPNPNMQILLNLLQKMIVKVNKKPAPTTTTTTTAAPETTTTTTQATTTEATTTTTTEATTTTTTPALTTTPATTTTTAATTTTTALPFPTYTIQPINQQSLLMEALLSHMLEPSAGSSASLNYIGNTGKQISLNSGTASQGSSSSLSNFGLSSQAATGSQTNVGQGSQLGLGAGFGNSVALDVYAAALANQATSPNPLLDPLQLPGVLSGSPGGGANTAPADLAWLQNYIPQLALTKHGKVAVVKKLANNNKTKAFISKKLSV